MPDWVRGQARAPVLVDLLRRRRRARQAFSLIVEQNLAFALRIADHVYLISKGRIVHESPPDALLANDEVKARFLGV